MAKSSRSSVTKKNRSKLKARVFGPAENARTQRLSARLMDLASQPKAPKSEMQVDQTTEPAEDGSESKETGHAADDAAMEVDDDKKVQPSSRKAEKKRKEAKSARIEKKRHRKNVNSITFAKKPGKKSR